MAALNFNPLEHDVLGEGYTVYPAGRYPVAVKKDEVKGNAANTSGYLQLDLEILDGQHKGGVIPWRINLYNQNDQAREIAGRELATVCFACNIHHLPDSSMLRGIPFQVQVAENEMDYRPQDDRSKPKKKTNNVVGVYTINGEAVSKPGQGGGNAGGNAGGPPANFGQNNGGGQSQPQNDPNANNGGGQNGGGNGWQGGGQPQGDPNAQNGGQGGNGGGWQGNAGNGGGNASGGWQGNAGGNGGQNAGNGGGGGAWNPGNGGGQSSGGAPAWAGGGS